MNGEKQKEAVFTDETRVIGDVFSPQTPLPVSETAELVLIQSGSGVHRIGGQSVPCCEGELYVIRENVPHGFFRAEGQEALTVRLLRFRPAALLSGAEADPESEHYACGVFFGGRAYAYARLTGESRREITALLDGAAEESEREYGWERALGARLTLVLICVSRYARSEIQTLSSSGDRGAVDYVLRAVEERFGDSGLTLEKLAAEAFVSPSALSRRFSLTMGQSFSVFLKNYRMERACRMLNESGLSVSLVSTRCGFRDLPSFYRAFAGYTGLTPRQYRASRRQDAVPSDLLDEVSLLLQAGRARELTALLQEGLSGGHAPKELLDRGLVRGMSVIGRKFRDNEIYVPEVLMAARAMNAGLNVLKGSLCAQEMPCVGTAVIGTVRGDMHDIGKNLVRMMLEGQGIRCIDLGVDVSPEAFTEAVKAYGPDLVCLSALLTTTLPAQKDVIDALKAAGLREQVKVMVGGAPATSDFAREIGADAYTPDAASAAEAALSLISNSAQKAKTDK